MSAETFNILNIIQKKQEQPARSSMPQNGGDENAFSKMLGKIRSREPGFKEVTEKTNAPEHDKFNRRGREKVSDESKNNFKDNNIKSTDDSINKTNGNSESPNVSNSKTASSETAVNEQQNNASSAVVSESILANIDFSEILDPSGPVTMTSTSVTPLPETPETTDVSGLKKPVEGSVSLIPDSSKNTAQTIASKIQIAGTQTADDLANTIQINANPQTTAADPDTDTTTSTTAQIKASDKVAAAAKEVAQTQSLDMSTKAKESAMAKLQAIEGTDTTVVDSRTASDSKNNSSFSQNNASEQIIKMSVENAPTDKGSNIADFGVQFNKQAQTAAPTNAQAPKDLSKADVMNQINNQLNELPKEGGKVTIILKPESLGRIHLEIVNSHEGIVARMSTESQHVKEMLDKNMEALKSQLGAQGVNVNNIKVEVSNQTSNNAMNFEREQFEQNSSRNQNRNQSEQNLQSASSDYDEDDYGFENTAGTETNESQIVHNGNVDYRL